MPLFRRARPAAPPAGPSLTPDRNLGDPTAAWLRSALAQRDWPAVRDFLTRVTDPDERAFYVGICADTDDVQEWIGEWVRAEPHSTLPLLVQGAHGIYWAWAARGAASATRTSEDQFKEFFRRLKMAENCLDEVVERDPEEVTAWAFLVLSGRGRQVERHEQERRYQEVVRRHPHHRFANTQMLQYLCKKWYGSHEEMFEFARDKVASLPPGHPLAVLIAEAHIEKWLDLPSGEDAEYMSQPAVIAELNAAADRSIRHPSYVPTLGWPARHHTFAFAFVCGAAWTAAKEQFALIGDVFVEHPWSYLGRDAAATFLQERERAQRFG